MREFFILLLENSDQVKYGSILRNLIQQKSIVLKYQAAPFDTQFFFVTDRIASGDLKVTYCPLGSWWQII